MENSDRFTSAVSRGPLADLTVIEFAGLGAAPFAAMMLADAGASVTRIQRLDTVSDSGILGRNRAEIQLNLKDPADLATARDLVHTADVLIEGFRPGVMERLGLGPTDPSINNPGLIYARMTGWGQTGPLAATAGHDINYLAITGVLKSIARRGEVPLPPLNLVGDYGGGGMLLLCGIVTALLERTRSGRGQIIDAAMIDGASLLMCGIWNRIATGQWSNTPGTNSIDSGAPFYNVYETSDGQYMAVGAIEPHFYRRLLQGLALSPDMALDQQNRSTWNGTKNRLAQVFRTRTRAEWTAIFEPLDACVSPVLSLEEAPYAPQLRERQTLLHLDGHIEPAPAPRYSRTPAQARRYTTSVDEREVRT